MTSINEPISQVLIKKLYKDRQAMSRYTNGLMWCVKEGDFSPRTAANDIIALIDYTPEANNERQTD